MCYHNDTVDRGNTVFASTIVYKLAEQCLDCIVYALAQLDKRNYFLLYRTAFTLDGPAVSS